MTKVTAQMPGTILEIPVKGGDTVEKDQEIMLIESMKMENPIFAPENGTVQEITVNTGDTVPAGQVLMIIE